jgi:hypothetical protein
MFGACVALPTYIGYYERGGWPTVFTEKMEPGDKGPRVKQVAERLLATASCPCSGPIPSSTIRRSSRGKKRSEVARPQQ